MKEQSKLKTYILRAHPDDDENDIWWERTFGADSDSTAQQIQNELKYNPKTEGLIITLHILENDGTEREII